jgi:CRP-like cAMP-binding protein
MTNPLIRKLETFVALSGEEKQALDAFCADTVVRKAGEDLIREGERPEKVHLLLEGWAFRYKLLPDGGRQIMAYLIPGDLCDIHIFILKEMDHSIGLLSDATIGLIPEKTMVELLDTYPRLSRALFWATLVDEATLREWLANTLRREPYERVAHLLAEMWLRMKAVGLVQGGSFDLPLTQTELGDTIGLNSVTVNRVLQRLRAEDLITLKGERLAILDAERLLAVSNFNPNYLHLDPRQPAER